MTSRTRVHRGHQHEVGGLGDRARNPADGNDLVFQGLTQRLQRGVIELGRFVQEEDAPVAQGAQRGLH